MDYNVIIIIIIILIDNIDPMQEDFQSPPNDTTVPVEPPLAKEEPPLDKEPDSHTPDDPISPLNDTTVPEKPPLVKEDPSLVKDSITDNDQSEVLLLLTINNY